MHNAHKRGLLDGGIITCGDFNAHMKYGIVKTTRHDCGGQLNKVEDGRGTVIRNTLLINGF